MFHLDADAVIAALDPAALVEALRDAHAQGTMPLSRADVADDPGAAGNRFVSLLGWAGGDAIAVKLVGVFPGNPTLDPPQPSVQGLVALFSGTTGAPLMTCDGAALTFAKTAADSALGADFLARRDVRTLLMAGAGGLAAHVIAAMRAVRPSIRRILIWNRTPDRARDLAARFAADGIDAEAVADLDAAVPQADIISCATMATEPILKGRLLKPGAHVDLIGAYLPSMREADDDTARRAGRLFVDTREGYEPSGDITGALATGIPLAADLFDLCAGRHAGRATPDEITLYKNAGGAHLDLFTARHLYRTVTNAA